MPKAKQSPVAPRVRCAIYTRKSTEEGLDQDFNSLDAQREAAQAYIASQQVAGWVCLPETYDDGGYSGGSMDRPALTRLLTAIRQREIDCVLIYKLDRLSRSLLDFAKMMETFEQHGASLVAVTQQFNSATSMGRLVLNVLLSFAQFERELIAERTRDKIAAARRKGKWAGGMPVLGYDVDPRWYKLLVNEAEAERVRAIFQLYLEYQGLLPVVRELARRGWTTKSWLTRKGHAQGGQVFTTTNLYRLLTNVTYLGKIKYKEEVYAGEHPAIVDRRVFQQVQAWLRRQGPGRKLKRSPSWALLKGLLHCRSCVCAMTPTWSRGRRSVRYRYYTCVQSLKRGREVCSSRSVPATVVEEFVVRHLRELAQDSTLVPGERELLAPVADPTAWGALTTGEQAALVQRIVERVIFDGTARSVAITLRQPTADDGVGATRNGAGENHP
jgi:site-specific DNA recombinase